jgi:maltose O-acetyltransferase
MPHQSEREIMLSGGMYAPADPELTAMRLRARRLCREFNGSREDEGTRRESILHELFGALGEGAEIEPSFRCDYGSHIRAGRKLFMNFDCVILDCAWVTIGDEVLIGPGVHIYAATHPMDPDVRSSGREFAKPVTIGSRVWIGGGAIILPGVTIGDNVVIGAGAVVTKDVAAGVVVGNPAKPVRV